MHPWSPLPSSLPAAPSLINADFCVAGCLIAYGAVLGKVSPVQLLVLTLFGITLYAVEEYIILSIIHVRHMRIIIIIIIIIIIDLKGAICNNDTQCLKWVLQYKFTVA